MEEQGYYERAVEYLTKATNIALKTYGENHPVTITYSNHLDLAVRKEGSVKVNRHKEILSTDDFMESLFAYTTNRFNELGLEWAEQGNYDKAIDYYNQSLEIYKNTLGEEHIFNAWNYNKLGIAHEEKGMYDKAIEYYNKAIFLNEKALKEKNSDINLAFGSPYLDTAEIYNNLGITYDRMKEHNIAIKFYTEALNIYKRIFKKENTYVASCYNNLGLAYGDLKEYDTAIYYHKKAYTICKDNLGKDHPDTIRSHNNILKIQQSNKKP